MLLKYEKKPKKLLKAQTHIQKVLAAKSSKLKYCVLCFTFWASKETTPVVGA